MEDSSMSLLACRTCLRTDESFVLFTGRGRHRGLRGNALWAISSTGGKAWETAGRGCVHELFPSGYHRMQLIQRHIAVREAFLFIAARTGCSTSDFVPMQILVARDPAAFLFTGRATDRSEWAGCRLAGRQGPQPGHFRAAVSGHDFAAKYTIY